MARPSHPAIFFPLLLPFGLVVGYSQVVTQYALDKIGLVALVVTTAQQTGGLPHTLKIFWAPALDARGSHKSWFLGSIALSALTMALTVLVDAKDHLNLYTAMLFLANAGVATSSAAVDALMATTVPKERKGAAAGWSMAGNLGGTGVGGALALRLTEHLPRGGTAVILAAIIVVCALPVFTIQEPTRESHPALEAVKRMLRDMWNTLKAREGWTGLIICLSPVGAGAAANLFAGAMHKDYTGIGESEVEWVTGMMGGIVSAVGCLIGGWIADRMNRRLAYALSGLTTAIIAVIMAFGPLSKDAFVWGTLLYQGTNGISYSCFVAFVLEMIGHDGPVATKYTLFVAAANLAISYTALADGTGYDRAKIRGLFLTDAGATVIGILILLAMMGIVRRKPGKAPEAAAA